MPTSDGWIPGTVDGNLANARLPYATTAAAAAAAGIAVPANMEAGTVAGYSIFQYVSDNVGASNAITPPPPSSGVAESEQNASEVPLEFKVFPNSAAAEAAVSAATEMRLLDGISDEMAPSTAAEESAPLKASTDSDSGFFSLANGGGGVPGEKGAAPAVAGAKVVAGGEGEVRHNNAYNDIGLVVTRTKELEKILKDMFGASGEFCHSVYKPGF